MPELFLDNLPNEILFKILYFCSNQSLGRIAQASSKWKYLTDSELLWKQKIEQELTKNPRLNFGQTHQNFYQKLYQGIFQQVHYFPSYGDYLRKIADKQLSRSNISQFLFPACTASAEIWVSQLIQGGAVVKASHLGNAFRNGAPDVIDILINNISNTELNAQEDDYSGTYYQPFYQRKLTLFHQAANLANNKRTILTRLFAEPERITVLPELHKAAACGDTKKLIELLGKRGALINERDIGKCTPLWWAIVCSQEECVKILITKNANLSHISVGEHSSALMVAIWQKQLGCLKLVVEQNVNLNEETNKGVFQPIPLSALHKAAEYNFVEGLELLISRGMQINNPQYNFSALHMTAKNGSKECVELLLKHTSAINQKGKWIDNDEDGKDDTISVFTPLGFAAQEGHIACIELLLKAGADPNINQEETDIHRKKLITHKTFSVLYQFVSRFPQFSYSDKIKFELGQKDFDLTTLNNPFTQAYIHCLNSLLAHGANPNKLDSDGNTPLLKFITSWTGCSSGEETDLYCKNYNTLLEKIAEILIAFHANVNHANTLFAETALHIAARYGKTNLVRLLIEKGHADSSKQNKEGDTPLLIAAQRGYIGIAEYLLKQGACLDEKNNKGETPLMCAQKNEHQDMIELIENFTVKFSLNNSIHSTT